MNQTPTVSAKHIYKAQKIEQLVEKQFRTQNFSLAYSNNYDQRQLEPQKPISSQISIANVLCLKEGDDFKKITEITIGKRVIILEDHYRFLGQLIPVQATTFPSIKIEEQRAQSQFQAFSSQSIKKIKRSLQRSEQEYHRRKDKKNIVKNIVKSYANWLKGEVEKDSELQDIRELKQVIDNYVTEMKFNNNLIIKIISKPRLAANFQKFLKKDAMRWLQKSKIKDKSSHLQAIQTYVKAIMTENFEIVRVLNRPNNSSQKSQKQQE